MPEPDVGGMHDLQEGGGNPKPDSGRPENPPNGPILARRRA
ncbi:MAG TPA: hypothetical protein VN153_07915 [Tahibacter sp.]|jgi:hypothetical protein|nr:hypothetical protein [Tahibacter sp.]